MENASNAESGRPAADPPATIVPAVAAVTFVQAVATMCAVVPATVAPELARSLGFLSTKPTAAPAPKPIAAPFAALPRRP